MSTNLHIDDIGNLILRDGKFGLFVSSQYVTPPHYGGGRVGALSSYAVEQVNHYYPYGGLFAESTGGEMQAFKYNGKELDRMCGLNWYDHGARHNDAAIGRWYCIDTLAEKYYSITSNHS